MRSFHLPRFLATIALIATFTASTMLQAKASSIDTNNPVIAAPVEFEGPGGCAPIPFC